MLAYLESANMSRICPPSSRVSPFCLRQSPTGRELDAIDFVAIAIPSLRSLRRAHIKRRRLIMPLVALVQKKTERTRNFVLSSGARRSLPRRRCSSHFVFEKVSACIRTLLPVFVLYLVDPSISSKILKCNQKLRKMVLKLVE